MIFVSDRIFVDVLYRTAWLLSHCSYEVFIAVSHFPPPAPGIVLYRIVSNPISSILGRVVFWYSFRFGNETFIRLEWILIPVTGVYGTVFFYG